MRDWCRSGLRRRQVGLGFLVANGFANSRAQSMKSCAAGVSVRFFNVTMPTGNGL
jgi:hypothetical protein